MKNATMVGRRSVPTTLGMDLQPLEGPRAIQLNFDFTLDANLTFNGRFDEVGMSLVQTMFVDNRNNNSAVSFQIGVSNQYVNVPPQSQGFFPCLFIGKDNLNIIGSSAGNVVVPIFLLNTFVDPMLWNTGNPTVTGTVTVNGTVTTQPLTSVYTSRSGAIAAGGTSQVLAAANGNRRRLFIQNPYTAAGQNIAAAESIFIQFGGAAGINDGQSIELLAGASFDTGMGPVSTEQVQVIAATVAHRFIAKEM